MQYSVPAHLETNEEICDWIMQNADVNLFDEGNENPVGYLQSQYGTLEEYWDDEREGLTWTIASQEISSLSGRNEVIFQA